MRRRAAGRGWRAAGRVVLGVIGLGLLGPATADGQEWRRPRAMPDVPESLGRDVPYDGRLTFARIRFEPRTTWGGNWANGMPAWGHDYPRAERNFMRLLDDISAARAYMDGSRIVRLDDPELFRYPIAYLCEPGFWTMTDDEEEGLRAYLAKGGFVIFDDFDGRDWENFALMMERVLPGVQFYPMSVDHPVYQAFFAMERLELPNPQSRQAAKFFGVFEDNDPDKRLLAIVNYDTDIGDYFEYSDLGFMPVDISNEAYKIGVNYWMYALTH
jgi:hypothetical protein